jgi:hypothetical protein
LTFEGGRVRAESRQISVRRSALARKRLYGRGQQPGLLCDVRRCARGTRGCEGAGRGRSRANPQRVDVGIRQHLVRPGLVSPDVGRTFAQAQHIRLIADYKDDPVSAAEAAKVVEWAAAFIEALAEIY